MVHHDDDDARIAELTALGFSPVRLRGREFTPEDIRDAAANCGISPRAMRRELVDLAHRRGWVCETTYDEFGRRILHLAVFPDDLPILLDRLNGGPRYEP